MVNSMTGFAARRGAVEGVEWAWDVRAVNGKGLDLRLRGGETIEGLEPLVRAEIAKWVQRGNVSLTLKLTREANAEGVQVNKGVLASVLVALRVVENAAVEADLRLAPTTGADLLGLRGVLEAGTEAADDAPLLSAMAADLPLLMAAFQAMRAKEGAALGAIIAAQVGDMARLVRQARQLAEARRPAVAMALRDNLARVLANSDGVDPARLAQELALLAVKADVTEELDRLETHLAAAGGLLAETAPIGRKLDFLLQEFMREANTLCSKSGSAELTRVGLDLKVAIDQMREQVQNVE